ncbi:MAG TPA: hypothetical protein VHM90_05875 [Phycisphaerae bacterium]|jgi:hypothetical protein|nr:hypothetical protein [Phycisphaerae bacterium]
MRALFVAVAGCAILMAGCQSTYTTPGEKADFSKIGLTPEAAAALTDSSVAAALAKKPLVTFPASIAVVRVQAPNYSSYSYHNSSPRRGAFSVITLRDIEKDEDFEAISKLPRVSGIAGIKSILLRDGMNSDLDLRNAAAQLNANLLLYYTLETAFNNQTHVAPLGLITLGTFPTEEARVTCTASAVLMDTRNGYVYAVLENTAEDNQIANAWTNAEAMDQVRKRVERKAFEGLVKGFTKEWGNVLKNYDKGGVAGGTVYETPGK